MIRSGTSKEAGPPTGLKNPEPMQLNDAEFAASNVYSFIEPRLKYLMSLPPEEQRKQRQLGEFWKQRRFELQLDYGDYFRKAGIVPYGLWALEMGLLSHIEEARRIEILRMESVVGKMPESLTA